MLGGFHSFGPGGYAETPLANVLPVEMERTGPATVDEKPPRGRALERTVADAADAAGACGTSS